jgi:hypothetical protein
VVIVPPSVVAGPLVLVIVGAIVSVLEVVSEPRSVVVAAVAEAAALESPLSPIFTISNKTENHLHVGADLPIYLTAYRTIFLNQQWL